MLVVSGTLDTPYERTYPKFDLKHHEYQDPTIYLDPPFPTHINVNGPMEVKRESAWTLQKQQWSAYFR